MAVVHTTMPLQVAVVLDLFTLIQLKVFQGPLPFQLAPVVLVELVCP